MMMKIIHFIVSVTAKIIMTTVKIIGSLFGLPVAIMAFITLTVIGGSTVLDCCIIAIAVWLIVAMPLRWLKKSYKAFCYDQDKKKKKQLLKKQS